MSEPPFKSLTKRDLNPSTINQHLSPPSRPVPTQPRSLGLSLLIAALAALLPHTSLAAPAPKKNPAPKDQSPRPAPETPKAQLTISQTALFHAGLNGVNTYRVPGIVRTPSGTLFAYCEARRNDPSDWGEIEIHSRRSTDGGKTWEPPRLVAHNGNRIQGNPTKRRGGETEQAAHSPTALIDPEGNIVLAYCINYSRCFITQSPDEGLSFSIPKEITSAFDRFRPEIPWAVIATGPAHGILTRNGRMILPVWLAYGHTGAHRPSAVATLYSDDSGATWKTGNVALSNEAKVLNPSEPAITELPDGTVMLNARSESRVGRRVVTTSQDGASRWSPARFDQDLAEPICQGSLLALSDGTLLFANPRWLRTTVAGTEIPGARAERKNLTLHVSQDGGSSWPIKKSIEEEESAYSDLVEIDADHLGVIYERGRQIVFARVSKEWLKNSDPQPRPPTESNASPSKSN